MSESSKYQEKKPWVEVSAATRVVFRNFIDYAPMEGAVKDIRDTFAYTDDQAHKLATEGVKKILLKRPELMERAANDIAGFISDSDSPPISEVILSVSASVEAKQNDVAYRRLGWLCKIASVDIDFNPVIAADIAGSNPDGLVTA